MKISVVIPTCNRKKSLFRVLECLTRSGYPVEEIIIVDSGNEKLSLSDFQLFKSLKIIYLEAEQSVCAQRNVGIQKSKSEWIFLCDDDLEIPPDYLELLVAHIQSHPESGAVSGLVMQKENEQWTWQYPVKSTGSLLWRYIFQLSIWGEISLKNNYPLTRYLRNYYKRNRNHISKAGWPVLTDFSADYFTTPLYGLGASLVRKDWLIKSPYDELLESHGAGDNYGVALGFPANIHVVKAASVYHYQEQVNRLSGHKQYFHRALALHYFLTTRKIFFLKNRLWFYWSLFGNFIFYSATGKGKLMLASVSAFVVIVTGNPLVKKLRNRDKIQ